MITWCGCDNNALWSSSCVSTILDHAVDDWQEECCSPRVTF